MKKFVSKIKYLALLLIFIPCLFLFTACGPSNTAEKLASDLGYSSVEQMLNSLKGKDGKDGKDATPDIEGFYRSLYEEAIDNGEIDESTSFYDFIYDLNLKFDSTETVVQNCIKSIVTVTVSSGQKSGSGVIYSINDTEAYIITNFHVVSNDSNIGTRAYRSFYVTIDGMENSKISASYVGGSLNYDIAVLRVSNLSSLNTLKDAGVQPVKFFEGDALFGTSVIAIGNPRPSNEAGETLVEGMAVSDGIISRPNELVAFRINKQQVLIEEIRHTCYTATGSSGGGLFNLKGELVGITNGGIDGMTELNYAIPSNTVLGVVRNIISNCSLLNDKIKIFIPFTIKLDNDLNVIVSEVVNENLSYNDSQTLATNDIIKTATLNTATHGTISIDITKEYQLERLLLNACVGDTLTLKVDRGGQQVEVTITLTENIAEYYD